MIRLPRLALMASAVTAAGLMANGAMARQDETASPASRTEATQITQPGAPAASGPGRAYLDETGRPVPPQPPRASLMQTTGDQISRGEGSAPASQISARGQGGPGMAQLSSADLDATLAQLSPAERLVLLQAITGSDICDNPPAVAAVLALCQNRLETRAGEFAARTDRPLSAEESLLRGDFENSALPSIDQVIERLARGSASSGDFSNQAIASIALGSAATAPANPQGNAEPETQGLGEETQALVNALINQLGGRAP